MMTRIFSLKCGSVTQQLSGAVPRWLKCGSAKFFAEITARWCGCAQILKVAHVAVARAQHLQSEPGTGAGAKIRLGPAILEKVLIYCL